MLSNNRFADASAAWRCLENSRVAFVHLTRNPAAMDPRALVKLFEHATQAGNVFERLIFLPKTADLVGQLVWISVSLSEALKEASKAEDAAAKTTNTAKEAHQQTAKRAKKMNEGPQKPAAEKIVVQIKPAEGTRVIPGGSKTLEIVQRAHQEYYSSDSCPYAQRDLFHMILQRNTETRHRASLIATTATEAMAADQGAHRMPKFEARDWLFLFFIIVHLVAELLFARR